MTVGAMLARLADPRTLPRRIAQKAHQGHRLLFPDAEATRFIRHNRAVWGGWSPERGEAVVLVDLFGVAETQIAWSYFVNVLARRHGAVIRSFGPPTRIPNRSLHEVYRSFNTAGHVVTALTREQDARRRRLSQEIRPRLQTKQDLFELNVAGVWIGIDVYETYLRRYKMPTVAMDDPRLFDTVDEGIGLVVFWQEYFASCDVAAVVVSHDCYLGYDVVSKVAYRAGVPVYLPSVRGIWLVRAPHEIFAHCARYRTMFGTLPPEEQARGIALAKQQVARRLSGEVGVDMPYATASAFSNVRADRRIMRSSARLKVLVCAPCFTDNPHAYGGLLFLDFYEWLRYLAKISERTEYDWYIKTHPDPLPVSLKAIDDFVAECPGFTVVSPEMSHHQLVKEGIDVVLTPYGSVGHEYPALGVPVINAGYNPHAAYSFNLTPRSMEEYERWLLHLDEVPKDIDLDELYEFYYMHHYYTIADDLVLPSYRQMLIDLTTEERIGSVVYRYFLERLTEPRHERIIENMERFVESGKTRYFSRGPE